MPEHIYYIIAIFFVAILIIFRLSRPKVKGAIGEWRVSGKLDKLRSEEYEVINNLLVRSGERSSQIDHIVISIYGIFVIETKNFSGWIHGGENSEYWTQSIYSQKTKFRNPIKQNWAHIYALRSVLSDYKGISYHPIIVFAGSAELKNVYTSTPVIYDSQLLGLIKSYIGVPNLSVEDVKNIAYKLNGINIQDKRAKKDHVHHARRQVYERRSAERALICPRCGADLVARKGQHGRFYGCRSYPGCRYTQPY